MKLNKWKNGVMIVPLIPSRTPVIRELLLALAVEAGASVSSIPKNGVKGSTPSATGYEIFDPEKVSDPEALPAHWDKVYRLHNRPNMRDCRELRYWYAHSPVDLLPEYPLSPCCGIFCIPDRVMLQRLTSKDLIHIGEELEEFE